VSDPARVIVLAGDGVGPEVTHAALRVLRAACDAHQIVIRTEERHVGGAAIDAEGAPISDETFAACRDATAILFGATGAPRWDHLSGDARPGSALIRLRRALQLCTNLRPVRVHPGLEDRTTLRADVVTGCDIVIVRELAGGIYYGEHGRSGSGPDERAYDTMTYSRAEIEQVARAAFGLALRRRHQLVSVDKANVLTSGRFWRGVVNEVARDYPAVRLEHALVDIFALRLVQRPRDLDVILTLGIANPVGAILSVELMLEHSLGGQQAAASIRAGVDEAIAAGVLTPTSEGPRRRTT
jgi:3-isopropylmalate dehydrogenase